MVVDDDHRRHVSAPKRQQQQPDHNLAVASHISSPKGGHCTAWRMPVHKRPKLYYIWQLNPPSARTEVVLSAPKLGKNHISFQDKKSGIVGIMLTRAYPLNSQHAHILLRHRPLLFGSEQLCHYYLHSAPISLHYNSHHHQASKHKLRGRQHRLGRRSYWNDHWYQRCHCVDTAHQWHHCGPE